MRYQVDAILFDLDGTLIEPAIDFAELKARVLEQCTQAGVDASRWASQPALEIIARAVAELQQDAADRARNLAINADRAIIQIELEAAAHVRPYPGVQQMLQALIDEGYRIGIVTRNCREAVDLVLERWPLPHQALLTRDDVTHVKPDPRHLSAALQALNAGDARVLMVGDHPMDIAAGRSIGAITALVRTVHMSEERIGQAAPDLVLDQIVDLIKHLDGHRCTDGARRGSWERG